MIGEIQADDEFLMSPKIDFVFKLLFGDEKNKDILVAFLSDVLRLPIEYFQGIELINNELLREFAEDRKGILDVRVKTKDNKQIDIEIQILPTEYMPERTLFYWSKMYTSQIKAGDTYDLLMKCITINIVDFNCLKTERVHSRFHLTEDAECYKLTDVLEIHFLELPKIVSKDGLIDESDPVTQWMEFIDAKSKGVMEMLAEKNENIKKAYDVLQVISKDENARMAYNAREAELKDQRTREMSARKAGLEEGRVAGLEEGIEKGGLEKSIKVARKMITRGDSIVDIIELTELSEEKVLELMNNLEH